MVPPSAPGTNGADGAAGCLDDRDRRILEVIDEREALELACGLIARPSENPPGNERACAKYLSSFLEDRGVAGDLEEVEPGRPNLYATIGVSGPTLVLCGHLDTVPAGEGWTRRRPFEPSFCEGLLFGRGACDMKAGLAAMTAALLALKRSGFELSGTLALHAVIDEEAASAGARRAAASRRADWVVVAEPSSGCVLGVGNGQLNFEITFSGTAVHSSHPEDGRNAIHDAAAFIRLVEAENGRLAKFPFPGIGPATISIGLVEGGRGPSTVADCCKLTVDRRVLPSESLDGAEEQLRHLLSRLKGERPGLSWEMTRTVAFPALKGGGSSGLERALNRAIADLGGTVAEYRRGMRFATDAAWYEAAGSAAVVFGPGDVTIAHRPDEHVPVSDLYATTRALAVLAGRLLS
ncbi:MAG: ArgE/DapE family deacylase [Acidimicrobiales bacterium]|jgi:acetylornithine deacetylase/succinyl-diaminopimelate desuccinylase family protein